MRVAIIAPPYPLEEAPSPPLGVCYVAAAFEAAGAEVKILDYIISKYSPEKLARELDTFQPDMVGSTSVTMNFPGAAAIVETAKKLRPETITMMGGPHATFDAENTLNRHPGIDLLVLGEGEETIKELVRGEGNPLTWEGIKGIAFRKNGKVFTTEPRPHLQDLDALPLPARHLLKVSRYQALGFPVSIITSRGCPNACIFCQGRRMVGHKVRYRNPVKVVDEIEEILSYGFSRINVADDLFLSKKERARETCREILKRGVKVDWSAFARVNTVDLETLHIMKEAGCDSISFGIESGNAEMLKRIRKGISLDQARAAVKMCKEAGILTHASFMVGLPGETPATLKETGEFARSLDIVYGYHFLAPFPGTTVREQVDEYDLEILTHDWSLYDANRPVVQTAGLSAQDTESFVDEYDQINEAIWDRMEKEYQDGVASPEDGLRVLGKYRMELSFRLLSEDILEEHCSFPLSDIDSDPRPLEEILSERVEQVTGLDRELISNTLGQFIENGHIKHAKNKDHLLWYWTHNREKDFGPFSVTEQRVSGSS